MRDYLWFEEDDVAAGTTRVALKKAALLGGELTLKFLPWWRRQRWAVSSSMRWFHHSCCALQQHGSSVLSIPEMVVLGRIFQPRLVVLFVGAALLVYMLLEFGFVWV